MLNKVIIINLIIFINIIFVNSLDCSNQNQPIYKLINNNIKESCSNSNNEILTPILYIEDYYNYNSILCDPPPISNSIENGHYYLYLDYSTEYSVTLGNSNCINQTPKIINIKTNDGPRLIIRQPKCLNSYAEIAFVVGSSSDNSGSVDGFGSSNGSSDSRSEVSGDIREYYLNNEKVSLPFDIKFESLDRISFISKLNNQTECKSDIFLYSENFSNETIPEIRVIPAQCNKDGQIIVVNNQDYTLIRLFKENVMLEQNSVNGKFKNLTQGQYYIIFESINCGTQNISVSIENSPPSYQMKLVNYECPNKPNYLIEMDESLYKFQIVKNSSSINNPFEYDHQAIYIEIENCGSFTIPPVSLVSYPPISYKISDLQDEDETCEKNYKITFENFNSSLNSIEYYNIDHQYDFGSVQLLNDSSFIADINYRYEIQSTNCYSNKFIIYPPETPLPIYNISSKTNYCNELIDIKVSNWESFTDMYIIPSDRDEDTQTVISIHSVKGLFSQVPNQEYHLYYVLNNCTSKERFITIGNNNQDANVYSIVKVLNEPNCNNLFNGILEISVFDNFTNNEIIKVNHSLTYFNDYSNRYIVNLLPKFSCNANVNFNYTRKNPDYEIQTLKTPICKYSKENATILISSSSNIQSVYINGYKQETSDSGYQVPIGNNSIRIDFMCNSITTNYFVDTQYPDFKVLYDEIPVIDCSIKSGGFIIKDYNKYSTLSISDTSILETGNSSYIYSSGIVNVDFSIKLGNTENEDLICFGTESIYIPTSLQIDYDYPMYQLQKPLCDAENSGEIIFGSLRLKDNNTYIIDKVVGITNSISAGDHEFLVFSGNCSWNISVEIKSQNVEINPILESYFIQDCGGNYLYKLNYSNILAEKTSSVSISSNIINLNNNYYISGSTLNSGDPIQVEIKYGNNLACQKSFTINPQQPPSSLSEIKYNVLNNDSPTCNSDLTIDIQIENFDQYRNLLYGNIGADSSGIFKNVRPGDYITASHFKYNCYLMTKVVYESQPIEVCQESKNRLGLILGLTIGIFCLLSLFVVGLIYHKKKKSKFNRTDFIQLTQFTDQEQFEEIDTTSKDF